METSLGATSGDVRKVPVHVWMVPCLPECACCLQGKSSRCNPVEFAWCCKHTVGLEAVICWIDYHELRMFFIFIKLF